MAYDKDFERWKGQVYKCPRCGNTVTGEEIAMRGRISCPNCGYRVIKKTRPPIVRRVKAI